MIPSVPYRAQPHTPYWGAPTAQSNFCEEDYILTPYIGEFINTITNITYILYCAHGIYTLHRKHHLTLSAALPHLGLAGVGIFSAAFHITLLEGPQLADDMSMVFPTAFILLRLLTFQSAHPLRITAAFFAVLITIYTIHLNINYPLLHSVTWGIMIHFIRVHVWRLLSTRIADPAVSRSLKRMSIFGGAAFGLGYFLWLIDRYFCPQLTAARRAIGMPWSFLLEFHGWWHILTGIGAYVFIVLAGYLTSEQAGKEPGDAFGWPANWVVGKFEERKEGAKKRGAVMNGKAKAVVNGKGGKGN